MLRSRVDEQLQIDDLQDTYGSAYDACCINSCPQLAFGVIDHQIPNVN